ncbi:unnamed protein product [Oikopleura dioica]|uniref:Uncharacterized protein n=1 Tax=Oikopleura dioica TaxID=34765 RepID=E4X2T3_OIKDI|nr:unnamed protein product [Oikopleura dioica]
MTIEIYELTSHKKMPSRRTKFKNVETCFKISSTLSWMT